MRRGAFTLIEIVIVVAIIVAISAIVLPPLASRLTATKLRHAERTLEAAAALAQAEALERGVLVALIAELEGEDWVLYAEEVEASAAAATHDDAPVGEDWGSAGEAPPRRELASFSGVDLGRAQAEGDYGGASGDSLEMESAFSGTDDSGQEDGLDEPPAPRIRLGTFFPDGSCAADVSAMLSSAAGDRVVISLRPLTGTLEARSLPRPEAGSEPLDPADAGLPWGGSDR